MVNSNAGSARAHHFISQCYLRGFTENGGKNSKLFVIGLEQGKTFETKPGNVAQRRDFNRVEGRPPGELESLLANFEGEVATALRKIAADRSLDDKHAWATVLHLVALFAVRHPLQRENVRRFTEQVAKMTMQLALATQERWESQVQQASEAGFMKADSGVTYDQMRDFVKRGEYTVSVSNARHLEMEFHVHKSVLQTLLDRRWTLWVSTKEVGHFMTSDHPVILVNSDGRAATLHQPIGHGLRKTLLFFPISRELFAVGSFEDEPEVLRVNQRGVAHLNGIVLAYADREAYATSGRDRIEIDGQAVMAMNAIEVMRQRQAPAAAKRNTEA